MHRKEKKLYRLIDSKTSSHREIDEKCLHLTLVELLYLKKLINKDVVSSIISLQLVKLSSKKLIRVKISPNTCMCKNVVAEI